LKGCSCGDQIEDDLSELREETLPPFWLVLGLLALHLVKEIGKETEIENVAFWSFGLSLVSFV
jgi:hypothetical protein